MPSFDLDLTLGLGLGLGHSETAEFDESVALAATLGMVVSEALTIGRSLHLGLGLGLLASLLRDFAASVELDVLLELDAAISFTQLVASDLVELEFEDLEATIVMGATTVESDLATITLSDLTTQAGSGQVARFVIKDVRPRIQVTWLVVSDGQASR